MLRKSISIFLSFLILILFFSACGKKEKPSKEKESIKVVAVMSLSGNAQDFGKSSENALDLITKELNKKKIQVIYFDDENSKEKVDSSFKELISKEKIKAIILSTQSNSGSEIAKIAAENQIIVLNATVTTTEVTKMGKNYIYNLCYSDEFEGSALAQFTYETLKLKNAAIVYNEDDSYSKELADCYKNKLEKLGGKVTVSSSYKKDTTDYSEALNKIKNSSYDILLLPDFYYRVSDIAKQARQLGIKTALMGGDGWDNSGIFGVSELQGSYFSSQFVASDLFPGTIEFKKTYENKFKALPDARAALTYDAGKILMSIFENPSQSDNQEKQKESLDKINIEGVTGTISFEHDKRAKKGANIVQIQNNSTQIISRIVP